MNIERQALYNALSHVFEMGNLAEDIMANHDLSSEVWDKVQRIETLCDWALREVHDSGENGKELVEALNEVAYCRRHDI